MIKNPYHPGPDDYSAGKFDGWREGYDASSEQIKKLLAMGPSIECNGERFEIKEVNSHEDYLNRNPNDRWGKCQHIWETAGGDWDAPPDCIEVECKVCGVPGQYYETDGSIYWPAT